MSKLQHKANSERTIVTACNMERVDYNNKALGEQRADDMQFGVQIRGVQGSRIKGTAAEPLELGKVLTSKKFKDFLSGACEKHEAGACVNYKGEVSMPHPAEAYAPAVPAASGNANADAVAALAAQMQAMQAAIAALAAK